MEKILSIIIPSYNMEKYLPQCIDSLLVVNLDKIEVWIVNDGSNDKTLEIANSYHVRFPNSIHVIDKQNGNYGSCVNTGLKRATGKYIKILDADDSFETINFESFIIFLEGIDVDLVISDYVMVDESGNVTSKHTFRNQNLKVPTPFKDCLNILGNPSLQMHAVTYNRDIFSKINYHQIEGISYTDQQWMYEPMLEVETVAFYPHSIYKYLVGRQGQTVQLSVSVKSLNQTMQVVVEMLKYRRSKNSTTDYYHRMYMEKRLKQKLPSIYRIGLLKTRDPEILKQLKEFDKNFEHIDSDLYHTLNKDRLGPFPLPYISYWRSQIKKGQKAPMIRLLRYIVMRLYKFH